MTRFPGLVLDLGEVIEIWLGMNRVGFILAILYMAQMGWAGPEGPPFGLFLSLTCFAQLNLPGLAIISAQ